jgi:hypothetical protein
MNIKILKESYPTPFPENEYNTMIDTVIAEWLPSQVLNVGVNSFATMVTAMLLGFLIPRPRY